MNSPDLLHDLSSLRLAGLREKNLTTEQAVGDAAMATHNIIAAQLPNLVAEWDNEWEALQGRLSCLPPDNYGLSVPSEGYKWAGTWHLEGDAKARKYPIDLYGGALETPERPFDDQFIRANQAQAKVKRKDELLGVSPQKVGGKWVYPPDQLQQAVTLKASNMVEYVSVFSPDPRIGSRSFDQVLYTKGESEKLEVLSNDPRKALDAIRLSHPNSPIAPDINWWRRQFSTYPDTYMLAASNRLGVAALRSVNERLELGG